MIAGGNTRFDGSSRLYATFLLSHSKHFDRVALLDQPHTRDYGLNLVLNHTVLKQMEIVYVSSIFTTITTNPGNIR